MDTYRRRMMGKFWTGVALFLLPSLFAAPARADLSTLARVSPCGGRVVIDNGTAAAAVGPIDVDCGNFTASGAAEATAGYVRMGTAASFLVESNGPSNMHIQALAEARTEDILTPHGLPAGTPGFLTFLFDISGENFSELGTDSTDPIIIGEGFASTQLGGSVASASGRFDYGHLNNHSLSLEAAEYDHFQARFRFRIVYEDPAGVQLRMTSLSGVHLDPTVPVDFEGLTNFADTITLSALELLDANGEPVPGASLSAASGTVYPLDGAGNTVSEPSSGLLLIAALTGLYIGRSRHRPGLRRPSLRTPK